MEDPAVRIEAHPALRVAMFVASFPVPLSELSTSDVAPFLHLDADAPLARSEDVRKDVRDLLRHGGYKPTGRGKPSSEYLVRAVGDGALSSINLAVDACNAVSLASGLPISVVDLDRATPPFAIRIAAAGTSYAFNASGQEIDVSGLLCVFDEHGPCANAVKDAQRTKTTDETRRTLSVIWAVEQHTDRLARAARWNRELLEAAGASTRAVDPAGD